LFVAHPSNDRSVDASTMGLSDAELDGLPWDRVFRELAALEAGGVANPDEQRQVGHFWLRAPQMAPLAEQRDGIVGAERDVAAFVQSVRAGEITTDDGCAFTDFLHIGIGGSGLGPRLVIDALADGEGLGAHFIDNIDPDGIARTLDALGDRLHHTLIIVVSKSGGTPEPMNALQLVAARLAAVGCSLAGRAVAVTVVGSKLDERSKSESWLRSFPLWDWVGGRFSVSSAVGLLPASLAGVDMAAFLRGAAEMDAWTRTAGWRANPAAVLAAGWFLIGNGKGDRNVVVLPYSDRLLLLSRYLQQVVMESLGQRLDLAGNEVCQGLTVYGNKGSTDQHAFVQQLRDGRDDFSVCFVQVLSDGRGSDLDVGDGATAGDFLQGFLLGTRRALTERGRPSLMITVPRVDAAELGAMVALFERAVGIYASLAQINAYHQPGVEAGKRAAAEILALSSRVRAQLGATPRPVSAIASALEADENLVFHLVNRLVATGRATRLGVGPTARFWDGT